MTKQQIEKAVNQYLYADGANDHHEVMVYLLNTPHQDIADVLVAQTGEEHRDAILAELAAVQADLMAF